MEKGLRGGEGPFQSQMCRVGVAYPCISHSIWMCDNVLSVGIIEWKYLKLGEIKIFKKVSTGFGAAGKMASKGGGGDGDLVRASASVNLAGTLFADMQSAPGAREGTGVVLVALPFRWRMERGDDGMVFWRQLLCRKRGRGVVCGRWW